uniref:Homing endonuclease LAGLIDADG domain-containing protein n=1 Tax=Trebouxia lynnae TaxID=1825957 RepID=A0A5J6DU02_9CHLO|nr:hypothetical protein [Trebouxia lynnae]
MQYNFYLESLKKDSVDWYLENRDNKYNSQHLFGDTVIVSSKTRKNGIQLPRKGKTEKKQSIPNEKYQQPLGYPIIDTHTGCDTLVKRVDSLPYFKGWLSGFIEGKGCFTLRTSSSKKPCFSISQKGQLLLLENINRFFGGQRKVRKVVNKKNGKEGNPKNKYQKQSLYTLEIYNKYVLKRVVSHCTFYPLYGEKQKSLYLFTETFI